MAEPLNSQPTALDTWLSHLKATGRSQATIDAYRYAVRGLLEWMQAEDADELLLLTKRQATGYVSWLTENFKPGGNQSRVRSLRVLFNWLIEEGEYKDVNPFAKLMPKGEDKAMEVPTADDVAAIIQRAKNGPSKRDLAMVMILATTGCRKGELAGLELSDLDFDNRLISFRISKTRARRVPMHEDAAVALMRWLRQRPKNAIGLWNSTAPYDLVDTVVVRASGGEWRAHALRRYFAVQWLLKGGTETSLIRVCGWKDSAMVVHYSRASADHIAAEEYKRLLG